MKGGELIEYLICMDDDDLEIEIREAESGRFRFHREDRHR